MASQLDQAQDSLSSARKMVADGKELYELALQTAEKDPELSDRMQKIALNLLNNGEAMIDRVRDVERSYSKRF